jgi:glycerol-3-phosphate cytidylyltransferase
MSKFKHHHEQQLIEKSDYCLASRIKEKQIVLNSTDRKQDIIELKKLTTFFDKLNIKYWIDYGTLLGSYRKNKVIKHDHDLDISILFEKEKFNSELVCETLSSDYYIMHHSVDSYICIYPKENSNFTMHHIDIYFWEINDKMMQSSTWSSIFTPKHFYDELETIKLEDIEFKCPRHLDQYLQFRYGSDFMEEKANFSPDKNMITCKDQYTAYTCGVYDMFHIGHLNLFKRIKDNFNKLIVGVHNDMDVMTYKKKPTISYKDRLEIVKSCKYVDEVYENADLITTYNLLNKLDADYVVAGREKEDYIKKYYQVGKNKLHLIERTKEISTSEIKNKFLKLT